MKLLDPEPEGRDKKAWKKNPDYRYVYNKLWLADNQGVKAKPWPIEPTEYPVIYKPIINLASGDCGVRKTHSPINDELPGFMWMEYLGGVHYTVDGFWLGGSFDETTKMTLASDKDGLQFESWYPYVASNTVKTFLRDNLSDYVGPVNVEVIGDTIIECHLRRSKQIDKCREYNKPYIEVVYECSDYQYEIDKEHLEKYHVKDPVFVSKLDNQGRVKNYNNRTIGRAGYVLGSNMYEARENKRVLNGAIIAKNDWE